VLDVGDLFDLYDYNNIHERFCYRMATCMDVVYRVRRRSKAFNFNILRLCKHPLTTKLISDLLAKNIDQVKRCRSSGVEWMGGTIAAADMYTLKCT